MSDLECYPTYYRGRGLGEENIGEELTEHFRFNRERCKSGLSGLKKSFPLQTSQNLIRNFNQSKLQIREETQTLFQITGTLLGLEKNAIPFLQNLIPFFQQIQNLQEKNEKLQDTMYAIQKELDNLKKTSISIPCQKPIKGTIVTNEKFNITEKWLETAEKKFEGEKIAFAEINGKWKVVAHGINDAKLYDKLKKFLEMNKLGEDVNIYFR